MAHRIPLLRQGHRLELLQGSREMFPALIDAIDNARTEVRLETYIFDFTGSGAEVAYAMERAARRGVSVMVMVDGYGSDPIPAAWQERFDQAGVQWAIYSPQGRFGMLWPGNWSRLHRKLCLIDCELAFCGGINILDDFHDPSYGRLDHPRFDFAMSVKGPLVASVQAVMERSWRRLLAKQQTGRGRIASLVDSLRAARRDPAVGPSPDRTRTTPLAKATLVLRDNVRNRTRIEFAYRRAISRARSEVIIANAYFVPGRKMRSSLVRAARRGVKVKLLLQGRYEYFMQYYAARPIYGALLAAGVEIYEYVPGFLHAKVAVIDGVWATVGSSNLDPLSLLLAREANVMVEDRPFAGRLRSTLLRAMADEGRAMDAEAFARRPFGQRVSEWVAFGLMRIALTLQGKKYL